jgi:CRISPR/Cas system-associated exonuclease Cas4 (RecB family)
MRVSNSMIETWMKCPLQARFRYLDKLPSKKTSRMTFGICVHAALEFYNNTGDVDKAVNMFLDYWDNPEKVKAVPEIWPKGTTAGGFRSKGIELIQTYHEQQGWGKRTILAQEHRFLVPIGEHEVQGVVDLLEVKKSARGVPTLRIVDYKTGSKKPYKNTLRLNTQFTIYDYASRQPEFWFGNKSDLNYYPPMPGDPEELWETYKNVPRRGVYFHLLGCVEVDAGERDEADFMRLYRVITEMSKAVENEVFVPCLSADSCVFCDYTEPCGVKIPEREHSENDDDIGWF